MKPSHLRTPRESRDTQFGQYHEEKPRMDWQDKVVLIGVVLLCIATAVVVWG